MLAAGSIDWTNVLIALIAGLPAILSAVGVLLVNSKLRTPSGKSIGRQVEDAHHTAIANNQRLVSISAKVGASDPALAMSEEAKVPAIPEGNGVG